MRIYTPRWGTVSVDLEVHLDAHGSILRLNLSIVSAGLPAIRCFSSRLNNGTSSGPTLGNACPSCPSPVTPSFRAEFAHGPDAGDFDFRTAPEEGAVLSRGEISGYETVLLGCDRKCALVPVHLIVEHQYVISRGAVYLEPVAGTNKQRKAIYLTATVLVAFLVHRLAVPLLVVVLRPDAVCSVLEE